MGTLWYGERKEHDMKIGGTEVEDATEGMVVTITKLDVKKGAAKKATACAAAQALCRQTGAKEARVHFSRAYVKEGKIWKRYCVPPALRNEILAFDRGGAFEPGKYRLCPIQPSVRLGAEQRLPWDKREKPKTKVPNRGKPRRVYHTVTGVRERMMADWE